MLNETTDGIRLIKMYGWEKAMNSMIGQAREKEEKKVFNVCVINSIDKAISTIISLLSMFIPIIIIQYADTSVELSSSKIFATLD